MRDVRRVITSAVGNANQPRREALVKQKTNQSLPSASAQRRTASMAPKGNEG